jgi:hypothetical protein
MGTDGSGGVPAGAPTRQGQSPARVQKVAGGRARATAVGRDGKRVGAPGGGESGCRARSAVAGADGDVAARLRSQSRALRRLASTRVFARGDDALLLEASAWLEVLGNSLDGRVQQGQGPALRRRK